MTEGYVYFIKFPIGDEVTIKVGFSINPHERLREFRLYGRQSEIVSYVPGTMREEHALHLFLAPYQVQGEKFKACRRLYRLMKHCAEVGELPPEVHAIADAVDQLKIAKANLKQSISDTVKLFGGNGEDWAEPVCAGKPWPKDGSWVDPSLYHQPLLNP